MKVVEAISLAVFMIGAASMDSESQLIPAVMTIVGGAVLYLALRNDNTIDME